jgi:DNA sulfur modification protein DndD
MKIKSLQLHNFRQFYGTTPRLEFSSGEKNTTIIHASNGAGKTTILNSLTWVLYEKHSAGFLLPDQIVNKRAIREAPDGENVNAWVEIHFEHDSIKYVVKRLCSAFIPRDGSSLQLSGSTLTMQSSGTDGNWQTINSPESVIGRILPEALHGYFFFDGERIEKIVSPDRKETNKLADATKMLLGVEALVRAERHLIDAKKEFETELRNIGEAGTKDLLGEKLTLESESENIQTRLDELEKNIEGEEQRRKVISAKLRELEEAKSLQARRDNLQQDQEKRIESEKQNLEMQKSLVSRKAYTLFLGDASNKFLTLLSRLEKRGELPAGIKLNFVDDLLHKELCICGACLSDENSDAYKSVVGWKNRAGLADVEAQAIRMQGEITLTNNEISSYWEQMHDIQVKQKSDREELSRIENELDEISGKLKGSAQQKVVDLEKRLEETVSNIEECKREQAINEHDQHRNSLKIEGIEKQVAKQKQKNSRQRLLLKRIEAASGSATLVKELREIMEKGMRVSLAERIKKLFSKISVTPYIPELSDNYELKLTERAGGTTALVPASQGENQVLSFSFIGAIVEEAKEWVKKKTVLPGPSGCQYPIVMDSPFGALDPTNRRNIAEHLNILADQVILLLTKTQWRGEVETALTPKIGKEYVISYNSPKEGLVEETIQIEGNNYSLVCQSPDNFEYSTIQEV